VTHRSRARFWSEAWLRRWTARGFVLIFAIGFAAIALHHH
jgi:hypothetical protein